MKNLIFLLVVIVFSLTAQAKVWRVNNISAMNSNFTSFVVAQSTASANDTLYFEGSTVSYGDITVTKPLVIIGPGYFLNENPQTQSTAISAKFGEVIYNSGSVGSVITGVNVQSNMTISESNILVVKCLLNGKITLNSSSTSIGSIIIFCNYMTSGITSSGSNSISNILICNNHLSYWDCCGSIGFGTNVSGEIKNNVSDGNILVSNFKLSNNIVSGSVSRNNNIFYNNIGNSTQFPTENYNLQNVIMTNVFIGATGNSTDGQWQLKPTSPAIGKGHDNTDCGMFGGESPYILSGLPSIPAIYEVTMPTTGTSNNGINVTVKAKTH